MGFFLELFFIIFYCLFTKRQKESWRVFLIYSRCFLLAVIFPSSLFKLQSEQKMRNLSMDSKKRKKDSFDPRRKFYEFNVNSSPFDGNQKKVPDRERKWVSEFGVWERKIEGVDKMLAMATHENQLIGLWSFQLCGANWGGGWFPCFVCSSRHYRDNRAQCWFQ